MAKNTKKTTKARTTTKAKTGKTARSAKSASATILALSADSIKSLARRFKENKARMGNIGKGVRDELENAKTKGLDTVAFRMAIRWVEMIEKDSAKGSLRWDQFEHVLDVLGFHDSYQKPLPLKKKTNGKQTDLKDRGDLPKSDAPPVAAEGENRPEDQPVH
jgi:hypothetical protein